jgi:hypothetical protein
LLLGQLLGQKRHLQPSGPRARRLPKPDRRRALELLAASSDGCTVAILRAHGFTIAQMVALICAGLATATAERVVTGQRREGIARMWITDAHQRNRVREIAVRDPKLVILSWLR